MKFLGSVIGLIGMVHAGYIGSYTARLGPADHYSSRGIRLEDPADILRQDRANYYRFGIRDSEDTGCGWFASQNRRSAMERMFRDGSIPPDLANAIRNGTPLVRVEVHSDHIDIEPAATPSTAATPADTPRTSLSLLRKVLANDALQRLSTHTRTDRLGFDTSDLRHRLAGVYFASEGDRTVAWVVLASSPREEFECHACMPTLSFFVYARERALAWRPVGSAYSVFNGGSGYGEPPAEAEMALVHIAPKQVALAIRTGYSHMGWQTEGYTLIAREGKRARRHFFTTMAVNNTDALEAEKSDWNSTVRLRPGSGPFYDIHLHRKGTFKGKPIDYTVIYRCDNGGCRPDREDPVTEN